MGGSNWSDAAYAARETHRATTGTSAFTHTAAIHNGTVAREIHKDLNPKGLIFRESRDSKEHPNSNAIIVVFDETGSMLGIPVTLQKKLANLMGVLIKKGWIEDPQIAFWAIGDATCDRIAPLQIGQFESGLEMDDTLGKIFLEGGGGGQNTESYELALYTAARHTSIDCFEKRGKKGYLFLIGDEKYYPSIKKSEVERLIGPYYPIKDAATLCLKPDPSKGKALDHDIPVASIIKELQERYEVVFFIPTGASNSGDEDIRGAWQKVLGQNTMILENPDDVCEAIALFIGLNEGKTDLDDGASELVEMGASANSAKSVSKALAPYAAANALARPVAVGALPDSHGDGSAKRL